MENFKQPCKNYTNMLKTESDRIQIACFVCFDTVKYGNNNFKNLFLPNIEYFSMSTTVCAENVHEINHFHTSCVINKLYNI